MDLNPLTAILLLCVTLSLFGVAGRLFLAFWELFVHLSHYPIAFLRWMFGARARSRRKRNYEILSAYMPLFADNPRLQHYLETLIDDGIHPSRLEATLGKNARVAAALDTKRQVREALAHIEKEAGLADLACRHRAVLAESQARLEHLRFKERVLSGLFRKIRTKYRV